MGQVQSCVEAVYDQVDRLLDFMLFKAGPTVPVPFYLVINAQKTTMFAYILGLMKYYSNWGITAHVYLALHGTYGLCWFLKHLIFPDPAWDRPLSLGGVAVGASGLAGYSAIAWMCVSSKVEHSPAVLCGAIMMHTLGVVLMMGSDSQKYFTLKYRKGLIDEGWFARCRNTNYLGEMMLYSSYAVLAGDWRAWAVLGSVWGLLFGRNMVKKDQSLRKKAGWEKYKARSWLLVPRVLI